MIHGIMIGVAPEGTAPVRCPGGGYSSMVAKAANARLVKRALVALLSAALISLSAVKVPLADDASAFRDLAIGEDFRVRVAAAMLLGRSKAPGARPALEKALGD